MKKKGKWYVMLIKYNGEIHRMNEMPHIKANKVLQLNIRNLGEGIRECNKLNTICKQMEHYDHYYYPAYIEE